MTIGEARTARPAPFEQAQVPAHPPAAVLPEGAREQPMQAAAQPAMPNAGGHAAPPFQLLILAQAAGMMQAPAVPVAAPAPPVPAQAVANAAAPANGIHMANHLRTPPRAGRPPFVEPLAPARRIVGRRPARLQPRRRLRPRCLENSFGSYRSLPARG